jgi:hypothetical protein
MRGDVPLPRTNRQKEVDRGPDEKCEKKELLDSPQPDEWSGDLLHQLFHGLPPRRFNPEAF